MPYEVYATDLIGEETTFGVFETESDAQNAAIEINRQMHAPTMIQTELYGDSRMELDSILAGDDYDTHVMDLRAYVDHTYNIFHIPTSVLVCTVRKV